MSFLSNILVSDFDGTMTRNDFYRLAVEGFLTPEDLSPWNDYRKGEITHFQALQRIFRRIRRPKSEVFELMRNMQLDPRLSDGVKHLRQAGWEVVVASAGCAWYVERMIGATGLEIGVDLMVHANPGDYPEGGPLEMNEPKNSPFFCPETGVDKAGIVRFYLDQGRTVAYAGDGYTDADAAMLVSEQRRFARSDLAETLTEKGLSFRPFEVWSQVVECLING